MSDAIDAKVAVQLKSNDIELDNIAEALIGESNHAMGGHYVDMKMADNMDLSTLGTGELFMVTRDTQKIENEDQLLPVPRNKINEVVRGAVENLKRQ
jgi:hypothetical protein